MEPKLQKSMFVVVLTLLGAVATILALYTVAFAVDLAPGTPGGMRFAVSIALGLILFIGAYTAIDDANPPAPTATDEEQVGE